MTGKLAYTYSPDKLVDYKAERIFPNHSYPNRTLQIIGDSPVYNPQKGILTYTSKNSYAVYLTLSNQAKVFAIGSTDWVLGVDDFGQNSAYGSNWQPNRYNPNAETVTRNVLDCFIYGGTPCGS